MFHWFCCMLVPLFITESLTRLSYLWWVHCYLQRNISSSVFYASAEHWRLWLRFLTVLGWHALWCLYLLLTKGKIFIWRYLDPVCWLLICSRAFKIQSGWVKFWVCPSRDVSWLSFKQDMRKCRAKICFILVFWNSFLPLYWAWAHFAIFWTDLCILGRIW